MTDVLVILDGASEPIVGDEPTSLERADTPVLDALAQVGTVRRLRTIPDGLPAGSETGIAVLLGWTPEAPVDRAALEAAALGIDIGEGRLARRVDAIHPDGTRGDAREIEFPPELEVHVLGEHKLLVIAPIDAAPDLDGLHVWPAGITPPAILDQTTVFIGARGAASGLAQLLGARVEITDDPAAAAVAEIEAGTPRVVVHVDGADEAAHERDPDAKTAFLSRTDDELLAPIAAALHTHGGTLEVAPDHGADPRTGEHDAFPVPALRWDPTTTEEDDPVDEGELTDEDLPVLALPKRRATQNAPTGRRLTERWAAPLPVEELA
ncbi:MAG: hypothetical protein JHC95_13710 [Solirubrobacteraceae bacterium]|nr:hypothetical protein [Solirubrobacteraceae bacterium]